MGNQPLQEGTNTWKKSLLQKDPKFAITLAIIPVREYISTTNVAAVQAGELSAVDFSGLYQGANRICNTYTNNPIHTNISKAEHLTLENLRKEKNYVIFTADIHVALVVMDKTEYMWKDSWSMYH